MQVLQGAIKGTVYSVLNGALIISTTNETLIGATHTISIREVSEQIIKVPEKYLPESLATKSYVEELIGGIENGTY